MEAQHRRSNSGVKKRSANACSRCRQQKIKCDGTLPCGACSKRNLHCVFDDSTKKVLVTKWYLEELQRKADTSPTSFDGQNRSHDAQHATLDAADAAAGLLQLTAPEGDAGPSLHNIHANDANRQQQTGRPPDTDANQSGGSSPGTDLINPLALDVENYMTDFFGRQIHLGTSSNWSFARRVLSTSCKRLGLDIPVDQIYFEGTVYELDWTQLNSLNASSVESLLPSADHAAYLINAVKFHCGQIFHLFDEGLFMRHFTTFHQSANGTLHVPPLWYAHYLLLIALAKLLVARSVSAASPPGSELFLAAMRSWPDLIFGRTHAVECVEILICASLYLQCLDFRNVASNLMGQAVRRALEQGLHTNLSHRSPDTAIVQRCRRVWWTVYMLDRQMTTLMGLPQAIRDDDVLAPLPSCSSQREKIYWDLHVKLSRVTADIVNTVYSTDGRLPRKFLHSTKQALQSVAKITEQLSLHVEMPRNLSRGGISRPGAHLHLLNHQCICLTTRPLVFSFLDRRLEAKNTGVERVIPRGSAQVLIRMCIDSAQQILLILQALKEEDLLESFLPFDLEAVFVAALILTMAHAIDSRLVEDHISWITVANEVMDDMAKRGNKIAAVRQRDLGHLIEVLARAETPVVVRDQQQTDTNQFMAESSGTWNSGANFQASLDMHNPLEDPLWQDEMTADQLREIANSLDLDGFDWMTVSLDDVSTG